MFGLEILDLTLLPALVIALAAGVLSFLSPCVLPIVPPYLAYISGVSIDQMEGDAAARRRTLISSLFFVLGLSTVFILLGFTASAFGRFFLNNQTTFVAVAGIVIMIFGAHFIGVYRIKFMDREMRVDAGDRGGSSFGAYVLGLAFAFGWTPCIGPILGSILSIAASEQDVARGSLLLAFYAAGLGIPFILVAAYFPRMKGVMNFMKRHMGQIEKIMGLLLWTVGLLMLTGEFTDFAWFLNERFPILQTFG